MRAKIIIKKATLFAIETWIFLCMALISLAFLVFDLITQGLLFSGSLVALLLTILFLALIVRAERKGRDYPPTPLQVR